VKIAMLVKNFATTGGSNRYAVELSTRLLHNGHEVHLYAQDWDPSLVKGFVLHRVGHIDRPRFLNSLLYAWLVRSGLKYASFDVIHSHQRTLYHHVISMHHPCYQAGRRRPGLLGRCLAAARLLINPRHAVYQWLESRQFLCPSLTHVIAVSGQTKRDILEHYRLDPSTIRVIYPGVDLRFMNTEGLQERRRAIRARHEISDEALVLILVGTAFKRKGLRFVIEALHHLRHDGQLKEPPQLFVLGAGEPTEFLRLAEEYGVARQVHFTGMVQAVEHYYAASDLLVLPTLNEPFGMVVLEAMAVGLPVIVSRLAGVAEVLRDGDNACLLEDPSDVKQLAQAILRLSDAGLRSAMGQRARTTAQSLTWEKMTGEIESLYREVVRLRAKAEDHSGLL
jgi:UDP-glucose:(heptosyl)LPS alpha-1,3-glucosyltransferase